MLHTQAKSSRWLLKTGHARRLRSSATEFERRLWGLLRHKRIAGLRIRRQQPIGPYIADFYCSAAKLVIELDGGQHGTDKNIEHDVARTTWLRKRGYQVLRFTNLEFSRSPDAVVEAIWGAIQQSGIPLPEAAGAASTLPQGEGGIVGTTSAQRGREG